MKVKVEALDVCQGVLALLSILKFLMPQVNSFYEKEVLGMILDVFDPWLLPWALFLNLAAQEVKKIDLPKWVPKIPVMLLVCSVAICGLFGFAHCDATGFVQVSTVVGKYALVNGCAVWMVALSDYAVAHSFLQYRWGELKGFVKRIFSKKVKDSEKDIVVKEVADVEEN